MSDQTTNSKLFGKYHDLTMLFLGFFLTTVVGGFLGAWFQSRSWSHAHSLQLCESERETAIKGHDNLSDLMDRRLLKMREFAWKLESARTLTDADGERKANRIARDEWSVQVNRNLTFVQRYFGMEARNTLETDISGGFSKIYEGFNDLMKTGKPDRGVAEHIEKDIDSLNRTIYAFDLTLTDAISEGRVGKCSVVQ